MDKRRTMATRTGAGAGERQSTFGFRLLALLPTGMRSLRAVTCHAGGEGHALAPNHAMQRTATALRVPTFRDFTFSQQPYAPSAVADLVSR